MQRLLAVLLFSFALVTGAFGQATLRVGDPVELRIGGVPAEDQTQLNNTYSVDAGGAINLPYIGKVHAEGMTPAQLARSIEDSFRTNKIYSNPNITIIMQPSARFVNVGGSVRSPSRVQFTEDMTLLTAINAAGVRRTKSQLMSLRSIAFYNIDHTSRHPKTSFGMLRLFGEIVTSAPALVNRLSRSGILAVTTSASGR